MCIQEYLPLHHDKIVFYGLIFLRIGKTKSVMETYFVSPPAKRHDMLLYCNVIGESHSLREGEFTFEYKRFFA